ncbi:MAG TPA: radical SAM protein, partial [Candidatus Binatus sp.]|nr:radical SAM protein [Candidatus Binatus sp.]
TMTELGTVCEHMNLPVQAGDDEVLRRMRRTYSSDHWRERIAYTRERMPNVTVATDIIVGFPGETDNEFEQTLELLRSVEYDEIFSFMYSPRPQTVSAKIYEDDIPEDVKKERLRRVQMLQQGISLAKNCQRIGESYEILIDGPSKLKNGQVMGRTRTNRIVNVAAPETLVGQTVAVRITSATANSLLGEVLAHN